MTLRASITLALAGLLLTAAPAGALELGYQDDESFKYQTAAFLDRADLLRASWVRIIVPHGRWNTEQDAYVHAAQAAKADGKQVMVALMAWKNHPTPAEHAQFAQQVVTRMGPWVDAWSPMNEPNHSNMQPLLASSCYEKTTLGTVSSVVAGNPASRGWKRVKPRKGTHRRTIRKRHGRKIIRYRRAHGKRARWVRTSRAATTRVVLTETAHAAKQCNAEAAGAAYRRVWDATAPVMAGKTLVVGDLAPGPTKAFMDAFYAKGTPAVAPQVMANHPYNGVAEAKEMVAYARSRGLAPWATEWGRFAPSTPDQWTGTLAAFAAAGVQVTVLYDTNTPGHVWLNGNVGWNTRMDDAAVEAVGNR